MTETDAPTSPRVLRLQLIAFTLLAMLVSTVITHGLIARASYTDAHYYYNAAERLASGQGLTDAYLWNYVGVPDALPAPSHLYWMPMTSLLAGGSMWLLDAPGNYDAAQVPFTLMLAATALMAYWLGGRLGGTARHRWVAGLLTLFSGFFTRFWGATDTFAPYAFFGTLTLVTSGLLALGNPRTRRIDLLLALAVGVLAGAGHLTRADGLLLLVVAALAPLWLGNGMTARRRLILIGLVVIGYLLVMAPWFVRNLEAVGTILPTGGTDAIWFTSYDELFNYPPGASPETLFTDGLGPVLQSRWKALTNNFMTWWAVEGMVIIAPLMLVGLWNRRQDRFLGPFWLYALGLHLAMTFIFPYPGYRGGLFHSAAALIPFWMALGVVGLDDVVVWVSARRRTWQPVRARRVFSAGLVLIALVLSFNVGMNGRVPADKPTLYQQLESVLPSDARVMINDPAALYDFTGLGGVVIPNAPVSTLPEIAAKYDVTHLLIETVDGAPAVPRRFRLNSADLPPFLTLADPNVQGGALYVVDL